MALSTGELNTHLQTLSARVKTLESEVASLASCLSSLAKDVVSMNLLMKAKILSIPKLLDIYTGASSFQNLIDVTGIALDFKNIGLKKAMESISAIPFDSSVITNATSSVSTVLTDAQSTLNSAVAGFDPSGATGRLVSGMDSIQAVSNTSQSLLTTVNSTDDMITISASLAAGEITALANEVSAQGLYDAAVIAGDPAYILTQLQEGIAVASSNLADIQAAELLTIPDDISTLLQTGLDTVAISLNDVQLLVDSTLIALDASLEVLFDDVLTAQSSVNDISGFLDSASRSAQGKIKSSIHAKNVIF